MKEYSDRIPRIYKVASKIAKTVKEEGGSLKNLLYNSKHTNLRGLYALIVKTLQNEDVLDRLIENSKILIKEEKADPWLIRVLITELLFGKTLLPGNSKPVQTVRSYQEVLLAEFKLANKEGIVNLDSKQNQDTLPRYARVNTLILSVADAMKHFKREGWELIPQKQIMDYETFLKRASSLEEKEFMKDYHIKELLVFPKKTEFFQHELYLNGSIILQDKASCLASWMLNPSPGSTTLDMCAAPGMKTTHLAAIMQNEGTLHAVEANSDRYKVLCKQIEKSGAKCVKTHLMDAFNIDAEIQKGIEFILVDPSCSGSGMVGRPKIKVEENSTQRLKGLATFQFKLLHNALKNFPDAKRIVYSTCSINVEENEQVVARALKAANPDPENPFFQVADNILEDKWLHHGSEEYEWGPKCLYSRPDVDLTNGFFIAVFDRVRAGSQENEDSSHKQRKKRGHMRRKRDSVKRNLFPRKLGTDRLEMLKNVKHMYQKKLKKIDKLAKSENLEKPFLKRLNKPDEVEKSVDIPNKLEKLEKMEKLLLKRLNKLNGIEKLEKVKKVHQKLKKIKKLKKLENKKRKGDSNSIETPELVKKLKK